MDPSTHPMHAEWQMDFLGGSKSIELQPVCISLHHMMGNIRSCPSSNLSNLNAVTPFVMSNSGTILLLFWLFEAKADSEPARLFSSCWLPTHVRWFLRARNSVCVLLPNKLLRGLGERSLILWFRTLSSPPPRTYSSMTPLPPRLQVSPCPHLFLRVPTLTRYEL